MLLKEINWIALNENTVSIDDNLKNVISLVKNNSFFDNKEKKNTDICKLEYEDQGMKLYYISLDPPNGNIEAFVIETRDGDVSYYDFTNRTLVHKNEIVFDRAPSDIVDEIENVIAEYRIDGCGPGRPPKTGALFSLITAFSMT